VPGTAAKSASQLSAGRWRSAPPSLGRRWKHVDQASRTWLDPRTFRSPWHSRRWHGRAISGGPPCNDGRT